MKFNYDWNIETVVHSINIENRNVLFLIDKTCVDISSSVSDYNFSCKLSMHKPQNSSLKLKSILVVTITWSVATLPVNICFVSTTKQYICFFSNVSVSTFVFITKKVYWYYYISSGYLYFSVSSWPDDNMNTKVRYCDRNHHMAVGKCIYLFKYTDKPASKCKENLIVG